MIFGKTNTSTVPEDYKTYYSHLMGHQDQDITLLEQSTNYLLGILMILSFLLSTALNPLVFYFNYHQVTMATVFCFLLQLPSGNHGNCFFVFYFNYHQVTMATVFCFLLQLPSGNHGNCFLFFISTTISSLGKCNHSNFNVGNHNNYCQGNDHDNNDNHFNVEITEFVTIT